MTTTGCVQLRWEGGGRWAEVMCGGGTVALPSYLPCHLWPPHHIRGHIDQVRPGYDDMIEDPGPGWRLLYSLVTRCVPVVTVRGGVGGQGDNTGGCW